MPRYRLVWTETLEVVVDAASESAARQMWVEGADGTPTDNRHEYDLVVTEEE